MSRAKAILIKSVDKSGREQPAIDKLVEYAKLNSIEFNFAPPPVSGAGDLNLEVDSLLDQSGQLPADLQFQQ